jgi:hypothetical protein
MPLCLKPLISEARLRINKFIDVTFFGDTTVLPFVEILTVFVSKNTSASETTPRTRR